VSTAAGVPVSDVFVSVVAPVRNDAGILPDFVHEVMAVLRGSYANYELVLVDDASRDDTVVVVDRLLEQYECVRLVRLSRAFGEEIAIAAGLDTVIGDFVVVMMPNQDPPAMIPEMVQRSRQGAGIVFGIRRHRIGESALERLLAHVFYAYNRRLLHLNLPENSSQFRVLSRQAVNAVVQIRDQHRYLRLLSANVGYATAGIVYEPMMRNPLRARRPLLERISVAMDMIVANSTHPLRVVTGLGMAGALLNVLYTLYILGVYMFKDEVSEGWTTLSLQSAGMFFLVFLVLTVLSEYVGHILAEVGHRPLYYVEGEHNSPVLLADQDRRNVVTHAGR
jgi:polyisoprenyl-phosphate glycosyltransferase